MSGFLNTSESKALLEIRDLLRELVAPMRALAKPQVLVGRIEPMPMLATVPKGENVRAADGFEFECMTCPKRFPSTRALAGHKRHCK